ncbi:hypothetical protein HR45_16540 [Shewanella mangrovi]|uniref:AMP-dependent synthetase/ligase domain-containing protein n=1 Tax=Shewanella mangrovi TaxID=1515746 RepID=A0A094LMT0_9GAMM|nr:AMP-binding protein [Shewanella mangrovi]KFZ36423.1 hypothetical protein HR45_16540 [Shewanella mangrovi]
MTLFERLHDVANQYKDQIALSDGQQQLSYAALFDKIQRLANALVALQVKSIALFGGNSIDWVLVDLACQQCNITLLPLPAFFSQGQINACIKQAGCELLLTEDPHLVQQLDASLLQSDANVRLADCRFFAFALRASLVQLPLGTDKITFTSGSTGQPKGVCLTNEHQWQVAASLAQVIAIEAPRHLALLPLSTLLENIAGIYSPLLCGGTVVIPTEQQRGMQGSSKLDATALLQFISQQQPNSLILIPQLLRLLVGACLHGWQPPASLRFVAVGGGKVDKKLLQTAHSLGLPVFEGYGLSECGSVVALNTPHQQQPGAAGRILPHCQVEIVEGEVVVSGACHLGYAGEPQSWYPNKIFTGDLGTLNQGWLTINGRRKHLLISSFGRNISPEWVESALLAEPVLNQCMVIGDAEPYLAAIVTTSAQVDEPQLANLMARVNRQLPDYAQVWRWLRLSDAQLLPFTTANGRLKRDAIMAAFADEIATLFHAESAFS